MKLQEACSAYIKLLKQNEELTPEQISLATESFREGWIQCQTGDDESPQRNDLAEEFAKQFPAVLSQYSQFKIVDWFLARESKPHK